MLRHLFTLLKILILLLFCGLIAILGVNVWVWFDSRPYVYSSVEDVPFNSVGMVLGTSKSTRTGKPNLHFVTRMDAAAQLYHAGKVKHLILSGDNMTPYYNEPSAMKKALIERGVPDYDITLDSAGFRTYDSVVRMNQVFGVQHSTIISERYHVYRAIFISRHHGINSIAFAAEDVPFFYGIRSRSREILARIRAVLDLYFPSIEADKLIKYFG
jgi:SanA protein